MQGQQRARSLVALASLFLASLVSAQSTNALSLPSAMPDVGASLVRVVGALVLVLALFLGGVWFVRNWQRLVARGGRAPKLNILETRSLGGRQAIYVVGYQQERFLISASVAGVNFLTHLPPAEGNAAVTETAQPAAPSFAQTLTQMLKGK
jgi:flagellar biogenesis protein FliO